MKKIKMALGLKKKTLLAILVLSVVGFYGCGNESSNNNTSSKDSSATITTDTTNKMNTSGVMKDTTGANQEDTGSKGDQPVRASH
jgi:hypothetical protein